MGAPVWVTAAGDLGTIEEGAFYTFQLEATDPDSQPITYTVIAGNLPSGLRLDPDGSMGGIPSVVTFVEGVPSEVGENVTSTFAVRAESSNSIVSDQTFSITVTGQDAPIWLTAAGSLGSFNDGTFISIQLDAFDFDNDPLVFELFAGGLPPGITLSEDGLISGYIEPAVDVTSPFGFDLTDFDVEPFDFTTVAIDRNYQFSIRVSDGKDIVGQTFTIFVTATVGPRTPAVITLPSELTSTVHDNYFAFRFIGRDFDGEPFSFQLSSGALPPGVVLDVASGWIYGYIPSQIAISADFTFGIKVFKTNDPGTISPETVFVLTLLGDINISVAWITPEDLGSIGVGEISTLYVEAVSAFGRSLNYAIQSGSDSRFPQGLLLLPDGTIIGRVGFETFTLDGGATTFDKDSLFVGETTFEKEFMFTIEASDSSGDLQAVRTFTLRIASVNFTPYESLFLRAFPSREQRVLYRGLIDSVDSFPPDLIYRPGDTYFGKQDNLRMLIASGLTPSDVGDYIESMARNHYFKRILMGDIKTARALNNDGSVKYEVIYIDVLENEANKLEQSVANMIDLKGKISNPMTTDQAWPKVSQELHYTADDNNNFVVYPNSYDNMKEQVLTQVPLNQIEETVLPDWMTSRQENGEVLGFIDAIPIVFTKPGSSKQIAFYIATNNADFKFNIIDFVADRYIWDTDLVDEFNKDTGSFETDAQTTFDTNTTIFDVDTTRFFAGAGTTSTQDDNDRYLKFPQVGIFR